jgi:hypothetical protein
MIMQSRPKKPSFWITNLSPMNITLADLAFNIKAFTSVNLLDSRHHYYTLEQLLKSQESGSLFKKRDKIVVRKIAPEPPTVEIKPMLMNGEAIPSRSHSIVEIKEEHYDELKISDDDYLNEMDQEDSTQKEPK